MELTYLPNQATLCFLLLAFVLLSFLPSGPPQPEGAAAAAPPELLGLAKRDAKALHRAMAASGPDGGQWVVVDGVVPDEGDGAVYIAARKKAAATPPPAKAS